MRPSGATFLAAAVMLALTGCSLKSELQTGLSEQEAQEIIVLLKDHGLDASRQREAAGEQNAEPKYTVMVRGGDQNLVTAWRILQDNGLPKHRVKGLEELFAASSGMVPTASEEKAKMLLAITGELSRTLRAVEGVVDARVHVVLAENGPLADPNQAQPSTASVLVKYKGKESPLKEQEVKVLVARGVEGLQQENVAVVFKRVDPKPPEPQNAWTVLGNQQVVILAVGLAVISALGLLYLVGKSAFQRRKIHQLQAQLAAAAERSQLTTTSGR